MYATMKSQKVKGKSQKAKSILPPPFSFFLLITSPLLSISPIPFLPASAQTDNRQ